VPFPADRAWEPSVMLSALCEIRYIMMGGLIGGGRRLRGGASLRVKGAQGGNWTAGCSVRGGREGGREGKAESA